jgi:hypothetical protein
VKATIAADAAAPAIILYPCQPATSSAFDVTHGHSRGVQDLIETCRLKEQVAQKEQRIQELEGLLMSALLRIKELERRLAKDSHNSSLPPSRDHGKRKPMGQRSKSQKRAAWRADRAPGTHAHAGGEAG